MASPATRGWSHAPSTATLAWMAVSLPLVIWDTGYVLLRPHTMPGGSLHWPLWAPYALYGEIDHMYGFKQWNLGNGFTAAQGALNALETALYAAYVGIWYFYAQPAPEPRARRVVTGRAGALAVLLGFSAAVMTVSKTLLYWLNEYYSGFDNIGHNLPWDLIVLWIIPNGAWLVFPTVFMVYGMGKEIISGLTQASSAGAPQRVKMQ
ncbi:hypothetical protein VTK56DRAFT_8922 [Thermocarpiscus australiensis]